MLATGALIYQKPVSLPAKQMVIGYLKEIIDITDNGQRGPKNLFDYHTGQCRRIIIGNPRLLKSTFSVDPI